MKLTSSPLYLIVAKFRPTRFGNRKSSLELSHVPSPTCNVFDEYVLLPGGASCGAGDIAGYSSAWGWVRNCISFSGGSPLAALKIAPLVALSCWLPSVFRSKVRAISRGMSRRLLGDDGRLNSTKEVGGTRMVKPVLLCSRSEKHAKRLAQYKYLETAIRPQWSSRVFRQRHNSATLSRRIASLSKKTRIQEVLVF